jgi:hypothetical protein
MSPPACFQPGGNLQQIEKNSSAEALQHHLLRPEQYAQDLQQPLKSSTCPYTGNVFGAG